MWAYLTPEPEVLHFGFKIPDIGYLRAILTVEKIEKLYIWNKSALSVHFSFLFYLNLALYKQ